MYIFNRLVNNQINLHLQYVQITNVCVTIEGAKFYKFTRIFFYHTFVFATVSPKFGQITLRVSFNEHIQVRFPCKKTRRAMSANYVLQGGFVNVTQIDHNQIRTDGTCDQNATDPKPKHKQQVEHHKSTSQPFQFDDWLIKDDGTQVQKTFFVLFPKFINILTRHE